MSVTFITSGRTLKNFVWGGCLAVCLAALPSMADDAKPADKPADSPAARAGAGRVDPAQILRMQRERLDQLSLTDEQKKKLDDIFATAEADLKKAGEGDRAAMMTALKEVRDKSAEVLTDEQKSKWQAARGGAGAGAGAGMGAGPIMQVVERLEKGLEKLDLTAEQKTKVAPVVAEAKKKFGELRTQIQNGDRASMREKFKAAMDDTRDKLKDILTPDQAAKLKAEIEAGRPAGATPGATGRPATPAAETPAKPADK